MSENAELSEGEKRLLALIERFEASEAALDERIRQAHTATKDLRLADKAAEARQAELLRLVKETTEETIKQQIQPLLDEVSASLSQQFTELIESARKQAIRIFQAEIENVWKDRNGDDLRDVVKSWKEMLTVLPVLGKPGSDKKPNK
jgi:chromatin segregation and condensation protein Rec8/ScpA/Scc1 (kleisin family)